MGTTQYQALKKKESLTPMIPHPVTAQPRRSPRWGLWALSLSCIAWAGVSRFGGMPRSVPLDDAIRTLSVSSSSASERELALGAIASRTHELIDALGLHARTEGITGEYARVHLRKLAEHIEKERAR